MREVKLYGDKAAGRVALVDDQDYELVSARRWYLYERYREEGKRIHGPYANRTVHSNGRSRTFGMHVVIMGRPYIDHVNHNGLDNRRVNLRPASGSQNQHNTRPYIGTSSQYKGVYWKKSSRRWVAQIAIDCRRMHLGSFSDEIAAACAYDDAALTAWGEFAYLNFPLDIPAGAVLLEPREDSAA